MFCYSCHSVLTVNAPSVRMVGVIITFLFMGSVHKVYLKIIFYLRLLLSFSRRAPRLYSICRILLLPLLLLWLNGLCFRSSFTSHLSYNFLNDLILITLFPCSSFAIISLHAQFVSYFNGKNKCGLVFQCCFYASELNRSWQIC
jgi:hypothetical protein